MGAVSSPTFLDLAASIDRRLNRNIQYPARTVGSGTTVVADTDRVLLVDASAGAATLQLLSATARRGMIFFFKKIDSSANPVTVLPSGSQTIDGQPSLVLSTPQDAQVITSDGANWRRIASLGGGGGTDIFAATRIVSQNPGEGTDTTIQDALDNLPAQGGRIFVREGIYTLSASILLPDNPVEIVGAGPLSTVIDCQTFPAFAIPAGISPPSVIVRNLTIGSTVGGPPSAAVQATSTPLGDIVFDAVDFENIDAILRSTSPVAGSLRIRNCVSGVALAPVNRIAEYVSAPSWFLVIEGSSLFTTSPTVFSAPSRAWILDSTIDDFSFLEANGELPLAFGSKIDSCGFTGIRVRTVGLNANIANSNFVFSQINLQGSEATIAGCKFRDNPTLPTIVVTGGRNAISGCTFESNVVTPIQEVGNPLDNVYAGNVGYKTTSVFGENARVEGSRIHRGSGTVGATFVQVFSARNPVGVPLVGTIRNTGVDSLQIRQTVVDLFGNVGVLTSNVSSGNTALVSSLVDVGTGRPPYSELTLEARAPNGTTGYEYRMMTYSEVF